MSIMESLEKILNSMEEKIIKTVDEDVIITKQDQEADEDIKKLLIADKEESGVTEMLSIFSLIKNLQKSMLSDGCCPQNPTFIPFSLYVLIAKVIIRL